MTAQEILDTLTIESTAPVGMVKSDDWICVHYSVTVKRNDRLVITTDYYMGLGHFKPDKSDVRAAWHKHPIGDIIATWHDRPMAKFIDKQAHADAAAFIAKRRKIKPTLADIMHCLLSDGAAHFDHQTFEEWADDFGYDHDSRKAEEAFKICDNTGRAIARAFTAEELNVLREWGWEQ